MGNTVNRHTLRQLLRDSNALPCSSIIVGSKDPAYNITDDAVVERLRNEARKLNDVADRVAKVNQNIAGVREQLKPR